MNILLAASDRDLLACYRILLSEQFGPVVTAFDGVQAMTLLGEVRFDTVILDSGIPRVSCADIVAKLNAEKIPVIVLTGGAVTSVTLDSEPLANAYMKYPFSPDELAAQIKDISAKAASEETIRLGGVEVDVAGFRIKDGARLTAKEIDIFEALAGGSSPASGGRSAVNSLNAKLARAGAGARIKYGTKEGYGLVSDNE